jgi:hypothetical protein
LASALVLALMMVVDELKHFLQLVQGKQRDKLLDDFIEICCTEY